MTAAVTESSDTLTQRFAPYVLLCLVCVSFLWQTSLVRKTQSPTYDETYYLNCGLQSIHDGRLDPRICAEGIAPLPLMVTYLPPLASTGGEARPMPWVGQFKDPEYLSGPRILNSILFGLPLLIVCFFWLKKRQGLVAAMTGATLVSLSPLIVAHSSLATMDLGFAFAGLVALLAIGWAIQQPNFKRLALAATATAVALSSKYSAVFLLPTMLALLLFTPATGDANPDQPLRVQSLRGWKQAIKLFVLWGILILPIWWALHLFSFTGPLKNFPLNETPDDSPWVQILGRGPWADWFMELAHHTLKRPAPISGVLFQYLHNKAGHPAYLMGEVSQYGWCYYFPCAFAFKSTPIELVLTGLLGIAVLVSLRSPVQAWRKLDPVLKSILIGSTIFIALVLTAKINLGVRYLILLYPILIICGVDLLASLLRTRPNAFAGIAILLVVSQSISCLGSHPHQIAYFNAISGGLPNAKYLLSDSNIDWGQDFPTLHRTLEEWNHPRVALDYYGTALPEAFGIQADYLDDLKSPLEDYDVLAVSLTKLQFGSRSGGCYEQLWKLKPDAVAGVSIYLYRLDRSEIREIFANSVDCVRRKPERNSL